MAYRPQIKKLDYYEASGGGGANPFDQDLNTTDSVTFTNATLNGGSGDLLTLNATGTNNTIIRLKDDGTERGAIYSLNGGTSVYLRSQANLVLQSDNAGTVRGIGFGGNMFWPVDDSTVSLGFSFSYWSNTYTDRLLLNSTAYLDGGTSGQIGVTGILNVGTSLGGFKLNISSALANGAYDGVRIIDQNYNATSHPALDFYNISGAYNASTARLYTEIGSSGVNPKLYIDVAKPSKALATRLVIDKDGNVGVGTTSPTTKLDINNDKLRLRTAKTPTSATDTGDAGDICWDTNYIYVCTATNTWKRAALATW